MQTLEILQEHKRAMEEFVSSFDDSCKDDYEYISANDYINKLNKAIVELKALQNRSCDGCKHIDRSVVSIQEHLSCICWRCSRYCMDRYDAKGEQR